MKKVVRTISVDAEVYERAAEICRNELHIAISDAINQLLIGLNNGEFHVSGKQTIAYSENRPRSLKKKEILKILTDVFEKKELKIEKCIYNRKPFYKVLDKNRKIIFVFFFAIRDMENMSYVYRIPENIVKTLFCFANEEEKLSNMEKGEIQPMLFSHVITPGNVFTWSFVNLKRKEFITPQEAKKSPYPVYRIAGKSEKDDANGIGDFLFRVKTWQDMEYTTELTYESLNMVEGIYEELDLSLRENMITSVLL